ncbi:MAG: hypothetical protein KA004_08910 [Verrucomicrobiales bacterium]|nr:hypothetical protein [Verrucomicrobiales bacterium]
MSRLKDSLLLGGTLSGLFAAGVGAGYFVAKHPATPTDPQPAAPPKIVAKDWWSKSLETLSGNLHLSDAQRQRVVPLLQATADRIFLNRDRALFQMHLQLLDFHDVLQREPNLLDEDQQQQLARLREALRRRITGQFSHLTADSVPETASSP